MLEYINGLTKLLIDHPQSFQLIEPLARLFSFSSVEQKHVYRKGNNLQIIIISLNRYQSKKESKSLTLLLLAVRNDTSSHHYTNHSGLRIVEECISYSFNALRENIGSA